MAKKRARRVTHHKTKRRTVHRKSGAKNALGAAFRR